MKKLLVTLKMIVLFTLFGYGQDQDTVKLYEHYQKAFVDQFSFTTGGVIEPSTCEFRSIINKEQLNHLKEVVDKSYENEGTYYKQEKEKRTLVVKIGLNNSAWFIDSINRVDIIKTWGPDGVQLLFPRKGLMSKLSDLLSSEKKDPHYCNFKYELRSFRFKDSDLARGIREGNNELTFEFLAEGDVILKSTFPFIVNIKDDPLSAYGKRTPIEESKAHQKYRKIIENEQKAHNDKHGHKLLAAAVLDERWDIIRDNNYAKTILYKEKYFWEIKRLGSGNYLFSLRRLRKDHVGGGKYSKTRLTGGSVDIIPEFVYERIIELYPYTKI